MKPLFIRSRRSGLLAAGMVVLLAAAGLAADHPECGRLAGIVTDRAGAPLIDATVVIVGPGITRRVERVLTDAHGRFSAGDLLPGRYSLVVASTRLQRDGIDVRAGQISELSLMLSTLLPQVTRSREGTNRGGDDWKWVLRSASSVRPVLRYHAAGPGNSAPALLDVGQRLVAMMPESAGADVLSDQVQLGTVLAYWRPLTEGTDVLVASALAGQGVSGSSLITSVRHRSANGATDEIAIIGHQLGFGDGAPIGPLGAVPALVNAHGVALAFGDSRQMTGSLKLSTGLQVNYLDAFQGTAMVMPRAEMEYILSPASSLEVSYGDVPVEPDGTLGGKVDELNVFPRISMRDNRPQLEAARHSQVAYSRRLNRKTQVQAAAYHDGFSNAVVRAFGPAAAWNSWAGDVLPNGTSNGVNLNAGGYESTGARVSVSESLTRNLQASASYSTGDALAVLESAHGVASIPVIRPRSSQMAAAKMVAELPATKTKVIASYGWVESGRVTAVDPYGLADMDIAPYAGLQVRQSLPRVGFLGGAQIQVIGDFRNIGGQGYVRLNGANGPVTLTPVYRSFRGGFSVQF
jgi:hypothetical protein